MAILSDRILTFKGNPEKTGNHLRRWFPKQKNYDGGVALTAEPGTIIPRVHRDARVECRVNWSSEPYLDANGRSRIDFAFGLGIGDGTELVRLEAGSDKVPVYVNTSIEDIATGQKYFKAMEIFNGDDDQEQSGIMKKHLGDEAPYFPGLAYVAIKGFKLWKWPNKSIPALRAVVIRNVADVPFDTYDEQIWAAPAGQDVTSMVGDPDDDNIVYVTASGSNIYSVELDTNTWTDLGTGSNTSCGNNCLGIMNDNLYYLHYNDLMIYSGSGTTWNVAVNTAYLSDRMAVKPDGTKMVFRTGWSGNTKVYSYDGVVLTDEGYDNGSYINFSTTTITNDGAIYVLAYSSSSDAVIRRKLAGASWWETRMLTDDFRSCNGLLVAENDFMHFTHYSAGDLDFYHQYEPFRASPTVPPGGETLIIADTVNRVSDIEYFSKRYHFCRNILSPNKIFREETNGTITQLTIPAGAYSRILILQKIGIYLYCGTNSGFFRVGE